MNSAMMPTEGFYSVKEVSKQDFINQWKSSGTGFHSSIGYSASAKYLTQILGEWIPTNRVETVLNDGDLIFICKLKYRLIDPADKKTFIPQESDYMYEIGRYFKNYQSFVA